MPAQISTNSGANQDQQIQAVQTLARLYAHNASELVDQPFGTIPYTANGRASLPIPPGFLLGGVIAHVRLPVTLNLNGAAAPTLSTIAHHALIEEFFMNYNGSEVNIFSGDALFTRQLNNMEFPLSDFSAVDVTPTPSGTGTNYTYDFYYEIPAVYAWSSLMGVLNLNSNSIHASVGVRWGDVKNLFNLSAGQTATVNGGYVEFLTKRVTQPQNVQTDGLPDLSKTYSVSYQDFALTGSGTLRLPLNADNTITRITINMLQGGTGNGSDVASYDTSNALQLQNVGLGWAGMVNKYNSPYWYWQEQMARNYGQSMAKWINRGTIVIDLDRHGGRDWINAYDVTNLVLTLTLGAAPPAGSKARVYIEQVVNSSAVPIR